MTETMPARGKGNAEPPPLGIFVMALLGLAVGIIAGAGAVVFRGLIGLFHNLLFLGTLSFHYDANVHTAAGPWGALIVLVPALGAVGVAFLVSNFAPEARGHGVPEVMDAIYYGKGRIRPVVALIKSIASALSIGSGGSVGREGPIAQIGSAFGSTLGQVIRMPVGQRVTLIAGGAGAGIAATFNTPLGGLAFAIELMLPAINARTVLPTAVATVTATYIGRLFLGLHPAFFVPGLQLYDLHLVHPGTFLPFLVLGPLLGLLATVFIHSIYWFEDRFDRLPGNYYSRHVAGMLLVGVTMWLLFHYAGHYYVQGVGYATIEDVLRGTLTAPVLLFLLVGLKLLVTSLTLGSGASGGIFSPALFMGALFGAGFGALVSAVFPDLNLGIPAFAIAGMAGMVAGATGAVVTATAMLFEMTRDYNVILPVLLVVALSYGVRKRLSLASIYTLKLLRRRRSVPEGLEAALDAVRTAGTVMTARFSVLPADRAADLVPEDQGSVIVLEHEGAVAGVLGPDAASVAPAGAPASRARVGYVFVEQKAALRHVVAAMLSHRASVALVMPRGGSAAPGEIAGVITQAELASLSRDAAALFESN